MPVLQQRIVFISCWSLLPTSTKVKYGRSCEVSYTLNFKTVVDYLKFII